MSSLDDAGVYQLTDELDVIQTVDFFTPMVDDPYTFGLIAAANALSDVYAMGGKPLTVMNIVCFPVKTLDISVLKAVLQGGLQKTQEAGANLVGGHSVDDTELKYGLSVMGLVHPSKLITNATARPGDKLVLTKPLGTGIICTAIKAGAAGEKTILKASEAMAALNDKASMLMQEAGANACTDITGFGLIGHAWQMADNSGVGLELFASSVPLLSQAKEFAETGLCPGGLHRNREFYSDRVQFMAKIPQNIQDVLFDPQTSGGLLISLTAEKADVLVNRLIKAGVESASIVGEVVREHPGKISVR